MTLPARALLRLFLASLTAISTQAAPLTVAGALKSPDEWFESEPGRETLANVLSHQSTRGDWPKNTRTAATRSSRQADAIRGTFDNGATIGELRLLARAFRVTGRAEYRRAFIRGLDHVLASQYPNGGWPQYAPPPATGYHRHITFNDGTMQRLIEFVRDVGYSADFDFVQARLREQCRESFTRAIDCVLKCQIVVAGRKTVWCAQHDEVTLAPRAGRAYELESLSGSESAGVLLMLMSLDQPSPQVVDAVRAGARWFKASAISGRREIKVNGDKRLIADPAAPPLWARFHEIGSNRPFYCGRDGVKQYDLSAIEAERRNGYAWHGTWGAAVLRRYAEWNPRFESKTD